MKEGKYCIRFLKKAYLTQNLLVLFFNILSLTNLILIFQRFVQLRGFKGPNGS